VKFNTGNEVVLKQISTFYLINCEYLELYQVLRVYFIVQDDKDDWTNSHVLTFSGIDSSYALPDNIAIITLQVYMSSA